MMRLLSIALLFFVASESRAGTSVPGYRPQSLAMAEIKPSDLRTLALTFELSGEELQAAHAAMTAYQDSVRQGASETRAAIAAAMPEGAVEVASDEVRWTQAMESVRDRIEARRRAGEFAGDEAALREAFQEAAREAQAALDLTVEAGERLPGWGDSFKEQANVLAKWYDLKDAYAASLRATLYGIVGDEGEAALDVWWLESAARRMMKRGRLSAEAFDPTSKLAPEDLASAVFRDIESHWIREHAQLVAARENALRYLPIRAADAISANQLNAWKHALDDAMARRESVRNHAIEGIEMFAILLDAGTAEQYRERARRDAFPGVWRRDRADRALASALTAGGLDAAQRGMVIALQMEHETLEKTLAHAYQNAMILEEGRVLMDQDVDQAVRFMRVERGERMPTPNLDEAKARRKELIDDTMLRLRAILTEAPWESIPGTRSAPVSD